MNDVRDAIASAEAADAVVARLGAGRFAIELEHVAEVGRVPGLTRVPGSPTWLAGAANWRGRIVPVLDIRALLGADAPPLSATARLIVLTTVAGTVGVLVDSVEGTASIGTDAEPLPAGLDLGIGLVKAQLPRPDGPIALVDVDAVVRLRDGLPRVRRGA